MYDIIKRLFIVYYWFICYVNKKMEVKFIYKNKLKEIDMLK